VCGKTEPSLRNEYAANYKITNTITIPKIG